MTNERTDALPADGQRLSLFVGGLVLGLCLGFAAGHVLLWGRLPPGDGQTPDDWPTAKSDEPRMTAVPPSGAHSFEHRIPGLALGLAPGPFYPSAARRLGGGGAAGVDVTPLGRSIRVATETSTITAEPDPLPHVVPAAPIDEETVYREQVTRSIIAHEMPHATPQEQDVWFDVLRGLEAADVKGILRMRKHVEGGLETEPGMASLGRSQLVAPPVEHTPVAAAAPIRPEWVDTLACLRAVRDMRLHNLMNAETIGYRRRLPVLSEAEPDALGVRLVRVSHDMAPGQPRHTGNPLDVMIDGIAFLKVSRAGEVRLTRCGRLALDDERYLVAGMAEDPWRLDPQVQLPAEMTSLTIAAEGVLTARMAGHESEMEIGEIRLVRVINPVALQHTGGGMFAVTAASGPLLPADASVTLSQYYVERMSPAVVRDEHEALQRIERLIERIVALGVGVRR